MGFGRVVDGAAPPSVVWRVIVGLGVNLGTPAPDQAERIPGSDTTSVLGLSTIQLCAALLTLVLTRREGDRMPTWLLLIGGHRLSMTLILDCSAAGIAALTFLCGVSAIHCGTVDPPAKYQLRDVHQPERTDHHFR